MGLKSRPLTEEDAAAPRRDSAAGVRSHHAAAIELMESLTLSHGLQTGDALIAATAIEHHLPMLTANVKHFGAVAELKVEAFVP